MPFALASLALAPRGWAFGLPILLAGEALRLWAVGHIGLPSRTRLPGAGELVVGGPYARVRNPLYVGNLLLWLGFGVILWPAAIPLGVLFGAYYHFIVCWEEAELARVHGAAWRSYAASVPRWVPSFGRAPARASGGWNGRRAFRTERGTLLVLGVVLVAVAMRGG